MILADFLPRKDVFVHWFAGGDFGEGMMTAAILNTISSVISFSSVPKENELHLPSTVSPRNERERLRQELLRRILQNENRRRENRESPNTSWEML